MRAEELKTKNGGKAKGGEVHNYKRAFWWHLKDDVLTLEASEGLDELAARLLKRDDSGAPGQHRIRHAALLLEHSTTTRNISRCFVDGEGSQEPAPYSQALALNSRKR